MDKGPRAMGAASRGGERLSHGECVRVSVFKVHLNLDIGKLLVMLVKIVWEK